MYDPDLAEAVLDYLVERIKYEKNAKKREEEFRTAAASESKVR